MVIFRFLKPGGTFYVLEIHPFANVFDDEQEGDLRVKYPYVPGSEPLRFEERGSYADPEADYASVECVWDHPLSEIVNSVVAAGLSASMSFPTALSERCRSWRRVKTGGGA